MDSYSKFIAANKRTDWYADDTHTNAAGTQQLFETFRDAFDASGVSYTGADDRINFFSTAGRATHLRNGNMAVYTASLPTGWTETGTGVVSKETTIKFGAKPWSVKITSTSSKYIEQTLDATQLARVRGKVVSFAARVLVATGGPAYAGTLYITTDGTDPPGAKETFRFNPGDGAGEWTYRHIDNFYVPIDATFVSVRIYASADATAATIYVDEIHMYDGAGVPLARIR